MSKSWWLTEKGWLAPDTSLTLIHDWYPPNKNPASGEIDWKTGAACHCKPSWIASLDTCQTTYMCYAPCVYWNVSIRGWIKVAGCFFQLWARGTLYHLPHLSKTDLEIKFSVLWTIDWLFCFASSYGGNTLGLFLIFLIYINDLYVSVQVKI